MYAPFHTISFHRVNFYRFLVRNGPSTLACRCAQVCVSRPINFTNTNIGQVTIAQTDRHYRCPFMPCLCFMPCCALCLLDFILWCLVALCLSLLLVLCDLFLTHYVIRCLSWPVDMFFVELRLYICDHRDSFIYLDHAVNQTGISKEYVAKEREQRKIRARCRP